MDEERVIVGSLSFEVKSPIPTFTTVLSDISVRVDKISKFNSKIVNKVMI